MFDLSEVEKAYIAGLFDGEGSVCIIRVKPSKNNGEVNPRYFLAIDIANTNLEILQWLKNIFGGNIRHKSTINKPCYAWYSSKLRANEFLRSIFPYIKIKNKQIKLVFDYMEWANTLTNKLRGSKPWSLEIMQKKEDFKSQLHLLNVGEEANKKNPFIYHYKH